MVLSGPQRAKLKDLIVAVFDRSALAQALDSRDRDFDHVAPNADFAAQVFHLVKRANQQGWVEELCILVRERTDRKDILTRLAALESGEPTEPAEPGPPTAADPPPSIVESQPDEKPKPPELGSDQDSAAAAAEASDDRGEFPKWAFRAGAAFGGVTLAFFMYLVVAGIQVPHDSRFFVVTVLALGVALATAFLGGDAAAEGRIPLPWAEGHPVKFSVTSGIAVFLIVLLLGSWLYPSGQDRPKPVSRTIPFSVSNLDEPFAIKGYFEGRCEVDESRILVHVSQSRISLPEALPNGAESQYVEYVRVSLARFEDAGAWSTVASSQGHRIEVTVRVGEEITQSAFDLELPPPPGSNLADHWLVFEIAVKNDEADRDVGFSNVFTRPDFFSAGSDVNGAGEGVAPKKEAELLLQELRSQTISHRRRVEIGDRLAEIGDRRSGVGVVNGVPDILWKQIPAGKVEIEGHGTFEVDSFSMAAYEVTTDQFLAFVDAGDGYIDDRWWDGLERQEIEPFWSNSPRNQLVTHVSWYDATAFCRWLSYKLGYEVRLPNEAEWQWAAQSATPRYIHPWGPAWQEGAANTNEASLGRPVAVGMYPAGQSEQGVSDLCGNVFEWCRNEYGNPERTQGEGPEPRALRGGSWDINQDFSRAIYRYFSDPDAPDDSLGLRVACSAPMPKH